MRRISFALMSTLVAVIMMFGYRTSTPHPASVATTTVAAAAGTSTGSSTTAAAAPTTTSSPTGTPGTTGTTTVTGDAVQTRWGPVQVQLTIADGKVTAVTVLQQPSSNGRDVEINDAALPVLEQETMKAQSAQIDSVSGATYTSQGYVGSLQSALDQAGL